MNDAELIDELVLANRILYAQGVVDGYGHVSARTNDPERFVLARAVAPGSVTRADIFTFDLDGVTDNPDGVELYSERFIHAAIYRARPDVMGVVHTHSPAIIPYTVTAVDLAPIYHMAAFLGTGVARFDTQSVVGESDLLIKTLELGRALADALGDADVVLMRGHGNAVVGRSVREAVYRAVYTEQNARLQAEAMRMGSPVTYLTAGEVARMNAYMTPDVRRPWNLWVSELDVTLEGGER